MGWEQERVFLAGLSCFALLGEYFRLFSSRSSLKKKKKKEKKKKRRKGEKGIGIVLTGDFF